MIIDVIKYLVVGVREDIDKFFEIAQEHGFLEFISLSPKKQVEHSTAVQTLLSALKALRKFMATEPFLGVGDLALAMQVSERVLELKEDLEKLQEEKRILEAEYSRVEPFGNFSMADLEYIEKESGRRVQFFCMKTGKQEGLIAHEDVFYINSEYGLDYFLAMSKEKVVYPGMIEMRIDSPCGELENRLGFIKDTILRLEAELKNYAGHSELLQTILIEELNKQNLHLAKKEVAYPLHDALFVIEAWVPKNKINTLFSIADGMAVHIEEILVEKTDKVPTCLENENMGLVGEDLIKIYDIPSTKDKDPSLWVFWFFVFFFSIIVGDAGYGALFLGLAFYLKKKKPHLKRQGKRLLQLLFVLSYSCIVWGVLACSYFGLKIAPHTFLSTISPLHFLAEKKAEYHFERKDGVYDYWLHEFPSLEKATTSGQFLEEAVTVKSGFTTYKMLEEFSGNILLEFSLLLGVIHLSLSFLRNLKRHWAGLGWILFMGGGYLAFPSIVGATSLINFVGILPSYQAETAGLQLIYAGLGLAVFLALIQKRLKGIGEIAHLIQVFADVLSYLRLYALSLAAAILAGTFNQEGGALFPALGAFVILLGHAVNIGISFISGIIHGLRLNFLEWYHYCFEGSGRLFKPLKKLKF